MIKFNLSSSKNNLKNKLKSLFSFRRWNSYIRRKNFKEERKYSPVKFLKQIGYIFSILGVLFVFLFLIYGNYFRLKNISIISLNTEWFYSLNNEEIEISLSNTLNKNLLFLSKKNINDILCQDFNTIKKVHVEKILPDTIKILIQEYELVSITKKSNAESYDQQEYYLNENGYLVKIHGEKKEYIPLYIKDNKKWSFAKQIIKPLILEDIFKQASQIKQILKLNIKQIDYLQIEEELHFTLENDQKILTNINQNISSSLENVAKKIKEIKNAKKKQVEIKKAEINEPVNLNEIDISYIDFRIPGKVFVK